MHCRGDEEILTPSASSIISRPTVASVVHLQFAIALAAHRLCTLHLHTSHESPWAVTAYGDNIFDKLKPFRLSSDYSRRTLTQITAHVAVSRSMMCIYEPAGARRRNNERESIRCNRCDCHRSARSDYLPSVVIGEEVVRLVQSRLIVFLQ